MIPVQIVISDMRDMTSALSERCYRLVVVVAQVRCMEHPAGSCQSFQAGKVVALVLKMCRVKAVHIITCTYMYKFTIMFIVCKNDLKTCSLQSQPTN